MEIVIVTGLSGAGKSCAIDCFEDMGYYCIDNMPPSLIKDFIDLMNRSKHKLKKAVFVVDIRGGVFFNDLKDTLKTLKKKKVDYKILFLDASTEILTTRFNESRRIHPLSESGLNAESIELERKKLEPVKKDADYVIDTSNIKTMELAKEIRNLFSGEQDEKEFKITIQSFGYKYGHPKEVDSIFDVRFIPNPFYVKSLKKKTGNDKAVQKYVMESTDAQFFKDEIVKLILALMPAYIREGKYSLNIAFGCTGGQHRSVTMANIIYKELKEKNIKATLIHRDL